MGLQAYIDDSSQAGEVLILAGYVASVEQWLALTDDWQELLDMRPLWTSFKMIEAAKSKDPATMLRIEAFYRAIERHVKFGITCAIPITPVKNAAITLGLPEVLQNPYYMAFKAIVNITAQAQSSGNIQFNEPIDFIFDQQSEKDKIRSGWDSYVQSVTEDVRRLTGHEPIFRDDKDTLPLQTADFLAWWIRKMWVREGTIHGEKIGFPWEIKRKNLGRLAIELNEEDIFREYSKIRQNIDDALNEPRVKIRFSYSWDGKPF